MYREFFCKGEESFLKGIERFIKKTIPRSVIPDFPYQAPPKVFVAPTNNAPRPAGNRPPHQKFHGHGHSHDHRPHKKKRFRWGR
jgi:hypothetical protein